jgi:hypothetical protein
MEAHAPAIRGSAFVGVLACLLTTVFAMFAPSPTRAAGEGAVTYGRIAFTPPAGWKQNKGSNFVSFQPPDADPERLELALAVFAPVPTGGKSLAAFLDPFVAAAHKGFTEIKKTDPRTGSAPGGLTYYSRAYALRQGGQVSVRSYTAVAAQGAGEAQLVLFTATSPEAFQKHASELESFLSSVHAAARVTKSEGGGATKADAPARPAPSAGSTGDATPEGLRNGGAILRGLWVDVGPTSRSRNGEHNGAVHVHDVAVDLTNRTIYVAASAVADFSPTGRPLCLCRRRGNHGRRRLPERGRWSPLDVAGRGGARRL